MVKVNNLLTHKARALCLSPLLWGLLSMTPAQAIELKWFGAGCMTLKSDDTVVIVDPFVSRPSLLTVLTNQGLSSNKNLVSSSFSQFKETKNVTILITHNHYDHVLDLPELLRLLPQAKVYGPKNTQELLKNLKNNEKSLESHFTLAKEDQSFKAGDATITPYLVEHSSLPLGLKFAHGKMNKNISLPMGAFDYKAVTSLAYHIQSSEGSTLIHPTANVRSYPFNSVDNLIVGLTARNIDALKEKVIGKIKHKKLISIHNDNFFKPITKPISKMPFYPTLGEDLKGTFPKTYQMAKSRVLDIKEETTNESN